MKLSKCVVINLTEIRAQVAKEIAKAYWANKPVVLKIDCAGGDMTIGFLIAAAVKMHGNVTAIVDGECNSMTIPILQCAKKRMMTPGALMMFHPMEMTYTFEVKADFSDQFDGHVEKSKSLMEKVVDIISDRSKMKRKAVRELYRNDYTILSAYDALSKNLIDKIFNPKID